MTHKCRCAPDYACQACGHLFREPLSRRVLRLRKPTRAMPFVLKCPRCGSRNTVPLYS